MRLNIIYPTKDIEQVMWKIWLSFEKDMKVAQLFIIWNELYNDSRFTSFVKNPANSSISIIESIFAGVVESYRAISKDEETLEYLCNKRATGRIAISPVQHIKRLGISQIKKWR